MSLFLCLFFFQGKRHTATANDSSEKKTESKRPAAILTDPEVIP